MVTPAWLTGAGCADAVPASSVNATESAMSIVFFTAASYTRRAGLARPAAILRGLYEPAPGQQCNNPRGAEHEITSKPDRSVAGDCRRIPRRTGAIAKGRVSRDGQSLSASQAGADARCLRAGTHPSIQ